MNSLNLTKMNLSKDKILTKQQMIRIVGGRLNGGEVCSIKADCPIGEACLPAPIPGEPKECVYVPRGSACINDDDCGNGMQCLEKPYPFSGYWCN